MGADRAGHHSNDGNGRWWQRLADLAVGILEAYSDFHERSAEAIDRRIRGIQRGRRKTAVAAMSIGTAALVIFVSTAMLDGELHDAEVAATRPVVQATMLGEDSAGCTALIELEGTEHEAVTSCGPASYAPGAAVWVAGDPAEAGRFLVVVPGEQWYRPDGVDRMTGVGLGLFLGLVLLVAGYMGLLRLDAPGSRGPVQARTLADGSPGRSRPVNRESFLADAEAGWEGLKEKAGRKLERFARSDVRLRGSLMSLCVIAVFWVVAAQSIGISGENGRDQAIARSGPAIEVVLLEYGSDDYAPVVRHENTRVPLAHDLRSGEGKELGDTVQVVADPHDGRRLIPVSLAGARGPLAWFNDYGPVVLTGLGALALAGYLLIPGEVAVGMRIILRRLKEGPGNGRT